MIKSGKCDHCGNPVSDGHYCPPLTEIAQETERISNGWSEQERRSRFVGDLEQRWLPPVSAVVVEQLK